MTGHDRELTPQEEVVQRALHWVAVGLLALNLPLSTGRVLANTSAYKPYFADLILILLWVLLAQAAVRCARRVSAQAPLRGVLAVSCVALVGHPWLEGAIPLPYPPLFHVLGAALSISAVGGVRFSALLIPVFSTYVAILRSPVLGWRHAAAEAALLAVSAFMATGTVYILNRANRSVVTAVQDTALAAEDRWRAYRRAYERERWNGLVHDKVLGALRIAASNRDETVQAAERELATQALAAFQGDPLATGASVAEELRAHAALLGLKLNVRLTENSPDPEIRQAFVGAAREALTNVNRHSGSDAATATGHLDASRAELTVADEGRGFDSSARPSRAGIASSILGRVRAVGGNASVTSVPGQGTVVRLDWAAHGGAVPAPAHWQLTAFAPLMIAGAMSVVFNVLLGSGQWLHSREPVLAAAGIIAIVVLTAAVTFTDPSGRAWMPVLVAAAGICAVLAVNIPGDARLDWRYWFLGALTPVVGATAFRYQPWAGLGTAITMTGTVCGIDAIAGRSTLACLAGPVPVLVGTAVAGHLIRAAMNSAWRQVADQDAQRVRLRLAVAVEEEQSRETAARVTALAKTVGPDLRLIASGAGISTQDRSRMAILEGTARDHLAAPDLLDAQLVLALSASRGRAVRVDVVPGGPGADVGRSFPPIPTAGPVQDAVAAYRQVLAAVLEDAPPRAHVRAVWWQSADTVRGTITVVNVEADRLTKQLAGLVDDLPSRVRVTGDEDAVLVEVTSGRF